MRRVLVTGGAGFIGSQLVRAFLADGWQVRVLDLLTYAGRREHLQGLPVELVVGDVCDPAAAARAVAQADAVVHAAAESHVARSLVDPVLFLRTNAEGTACLLGAAARAGVARFLLLSTDEVFGSAPPGVAFAEGDPLRPGNPYAASKAAAEAMVHAWRHTWGYPAAIARCTNAYGPRQHAEKAIPDWIRHARAGLPVPVHGDGSPVRDWLAVSDLAAGIVAAMTAWRPAATWHFAGRDPRRNRDVAEAIAALAGGVPLAFGPDRPGQDARYALDDEATRRELGWRPRIPFARGLAETWAWYAAESSA